MTRTQCMHGILKLLHHAEDTLIDECKRLLSSGCIDIYDHPSSSAVLPKAILKVAMENCAAEMEIRCSKGELTIEELRHI